jgi:hypothetical protein
MTALFARTVSVSIDRDPDAVCRYVRDPRNLPHWAPGFAKAVREDTGGWVVETAGGPVRVAFAADNVLGVLDHRVTDDQGLDVLNPMRVIANADGAEVLFTVFRPVGTSDDRFRRDLGLVEADLLTLKRVLESAAR